MTKYAIKPKKKKSQEPCNQELKRIMIQFSSLPIIGKKEKKEKKKNL